MVLSPRPAPTLQATPHVAGALALVLSLNLEENQRTTEHVTGTSADWG